MTEQPVGKRAVETLDKSLVSMDFSAPATNICLVVSHFFGYFSQELAARVNLQHLWPSQRAAPGNQLKSFRNLSRVFRGQRLSFFVTAGDVDNGQCVFLNFAAAGYLLVWQNKKVCLLERVRCRYVKFMGEECSEARAGRSASELVL